MAGKFSQKAICWLMRLTTYSVVFVVGFIVFEIVWRGVGVISWEFLFAMPRRSGAEGGILPAIVGTFLLVAGSIVVAFPLGVATAIYLSEYARQGRFTIAIRVAIATLAGVPSIIFGLFGLGLFVIFLKWGCSILSGCATLACMILPTIIVSSEEALRAVPQSLREGSLALGATKWQTIWSNVLPYSVGGMLTGSDSGNRSGCRRDGPDTVDGRGVLSAEIAEVDIRPGYGAALSPLCAGYAAP